MPSSEKKSQLKVGQTHSLQIEGISPRGGGVAYLEGRRIVVRESLPGDRVQAQLTRIRSEEAEARISSVEVPSPSRVVPRCQHFGPCGGCSLQHLIYSSQVEWKAKSLEKILRREGNFTSIPPIREIPMEEPWAYRNKMEFSFGQSDEKITLGLHERSSFQRIVDISLCHIASDNVSELLRAIKECVNDFPFKAYNPKIHQGFWRYAVVRSSLHSKTLMLLIVTNEGSREPVDTLARILPQRIPTLKSIYWGVSTKVSDVSQPERMSLLWGSEVLEDQIGQIQFQIRPTNFVQPNLLLATDIYEAIKKEAALTGKEVVYDLYCGIGLIALSLAPHAQVVYGVESDAENVTFAQRAASLNGLNNALFLCGKVEDLVKGRALFKAGPQSDVIVVDPPRAGLHKEVYAPLLEASSPTLMYLSCNPVSLVRDLKVLVERDPHYRMEAIQLFDFFPHTPHMEALVTLRRR